MKNKVGRTILCNGGSPNEKKWSSLAVSLFILKALERTTVRTCANRFDESEGKMNSGSNRNKTEPNDCTLDTDGAESQGLQMSRAGRLAKQKYKHKEVCGTTGLVSQHTCEVMYVLESRGSG